MIDQTKWSIRLPPSKSRLLIHSACFAASESTRATRVVNSLPVSPRKAAERSEGMVQGWTAELAVACDVIDFEVDVWVGCDLLDNPVRLCAPTTG